jgi:hypothetical protein
MSLPQTLSDLARQRIVTALALREVDHPLRRLQSPLGEVGRVRLFCPAPSESAIQMLVQVSLVVPQFQLDSHMLFAATAPTSIVPHFTFDAVHSGTSYATHLCLLARLDLPAHFDYVQAIYEPLNSVLAAALAIPGLSPAQLPTSLRAMLDPWSLVHHADEAAFRALQTPLFAYIDHFLGLVADERLKPARFGLTPESVVERDRRFRHFLFHPDVDPVWERVGRLLGPEQTRDLRGLLAGGPAPPA